MCHIERIKRDKAPYKEQTPMKFHFTDDKLPEIDTNVLAFYGVGRDEFSILYLSDDGSWYCPDDTDMCEFCRPDYWAELPTIEEVEGKQWPPTQTNSSKFLKKN